MKTRAKIKSAKGATATEYGLVFGVFELTVFIISPILGKNLRKLGAKRVFNMGILTTGTCSVLFGVLDRIPNGKMFIGISIVVRAVEASRLLFRFSALHFRSFFYIQRQQFLFSLK